MGLIAPDLQEGRGTGSARLFSRKALYRAALVYILKEKFKMSRQSIRHALKVCQGEFDWTNCTLKIFWDHDGPEDQPYALNYRTGFDTTGKHDIEMYVDLSAIFLWTEKRLLDVVL
jgi:hypothetical protein